MHRQFVENETVMYGMFVIGFPDVVEPLVLALVVAAIMCLTLCQMLLTSACCRDVASKQDMSLLVIVALSLCYAFLRLLFSSFTPTSLPSHSPLPLHPLSLYFPSPLLPPSFSNSFLSTLSLLPYSLLPPLSSPSSHLSSLLPSSLSPTVI